MINGFATGGPPNRDRWRTADLAHIVGLAAQKLRELAVYKSVPLALGGAVIGLGEPVAGIGLLVTAQYWYGPVIVYLTQRMPVAPALRAEDMATAPFPAHRRFVEPTVAELRGAGFVPLARFASANERLKQTGTVVLLQHRETSDLAHVLIATQEGFGEAAETLVFSRRRSDGSDIATVRNSMVSPFPPNPRDSVLRVGRHVPTLDLWTAHRNRVAADPQAKRNDAITDALQHQMSREREAARRNIASGLWQEAVQPDFLRPTARGAVLMCLRLLPPWKQATRFHGRLKIRRLLRG